MLRVTPDANVIISGFYGSGGPRRFLDLAHTEAIKLYVSQPILDEVTDVLQREKFGWSSGEVQYALDRLLQVAEVVEPRQTLDLVTDDPDDNRIIECAIEARSNYIVTGDKHLLRLGKVAAIPVTPYRTLWRSWSKLISVDAERDLNGRLSPGLTGPP